tara:strand:- start:104 stop:574 length:471 start_codon:yes stop_codon:yes gene_type:complete
MQKYKVYINNNQRIIVSDWKSFCSKKLLIKAAGGLVYNRYNQILMIYRNNKWDLPKGKLEPTENIKECAIREVKEECGVESLNITSKLSETYHTYQLGKRNILKHTFWFRMYTDYDGELLPQLSEGITKVEWVDKRDILDKFDNIFLSIKELLLNE